MGLNRDLVHVDVLGQAGKRRNLGTFKTRAAAEKHERAVQFFKKG